ncbi:hypothetical protein FIV42_04395 [Persicimonas caeni]|uniref:Uncharacterized protein n=1 Tax=Persicimonas caeni TaxID=2292766 RepID=A0A4Y6PNV6_PERCE|nr:hypothetical protein [Persicimonas caeni]QDG50006.1 hypothetical protein FIV42_04395 [Persicimonas caeni]QED31227.1 hypothetical protein FRD00_04390 [Persicimonas caeni]
MTSRLPNPYLCAALLAALVVFAANLATPTTAYAQEAVASLDAHLLEQNADRLAINQTGMSVLLGWSALNMGVGTWGYFASKGRWKYFHQMNAAWNVVNGAIAVGSLIGAGGEDPASFGLLATIEEAQFIEKVLLFNAGLDIGYIAAGAYLNERGLRKDSDRLVGYGRSVMLQGAFLLVFDGVLFWLHNQNTSDFLMRVEPLVGDATGAALTISF